MGTQNCNKGLSVGGDRCLREMLVKLSMVDFGPAGRCGSSCGVCPISESLELRKLVEIVSNLLLQSALIK